MQRRFNVVGRLCTCYNFEYCKAEATRSTSSLSDSWENYFLEQRENQYLKNVHVLKSSALLRSHFNPNIVSGTNRPEELNDYRLPSIFYSIKKSRIYWGNIRNIFANLNLEKQPTVDIDPELL